MTESQNTGQTPSQKKNNVNDALNIIINEWVSDITTNGSNKDNKKDIPNVIRCIELLSENKVEEKMDDDDIKSFMANILKDIANAGKDLNQVLRDYKKEQD